MEEKPQEGDLCFLFRYTVLETLLVCILQWRRYWKSYRSKVSSNAALATHAIIVAKFGLRRRIGPDGGPLSEEQAQIYRGNLICYRGWLLFRLPGWGLDFITGIHSFIREYRKEHIFHLAWGRLEVTYAADFPVVRDYGNNEHYATLAWLTAVVPGVIFIKLSFAKHLPPQWQVDDLKGSVYLPKRLLQGALLGEFWRLAEIKPYGYVH